ncbi:CTP synthetase [Halopenitus salinus]|uniref:CTP synthetase n=1 Tax=Halopenitus salinus TaxID=1198295 RepID=A0ABD5UV85_9EURY
MVVVVPRVVLAGPDEHDLESAFEDRGAEVKRIRGVVSADTLRDAGIETAELLVITDVEEATGIAVAKELNPELKAVAYVDRSLPEFLSGIADLAVDPDLMEPDVVATELLSRK